MATISGTSNLDVAGIVSQLMQIERRPMQSIEKTLSGIQTQLSAWGRVQSALSTLQDAAGALGRAGTWNAATAASSDANVVQATAGAGAVPGSYSVEVLALASHQTVASGAFASADAAVGGGTLRIQLGTLAGGSFTADPERAETEITVEDGATLAQVRDAINAAGAGAGVTASLVADGTGQRLMLRSSETGAAQAFSVSGTNAGSDPGSALDSLSYDPAADTGMQRTQVAADAAVRINGLEVSAAGNRIEGVIENVTLDLRRAGAGPVDIGVSTDTKALRGTIDSFVKAYNALNTLIAEQTRYDPETKAAGALQGNQSAVRVQQQMRELLRTAVGDGELDTLNAIGVELQRDGSLAVSETKMAAALAQPQALRAFFAGAGGDSGHEGFAALLTQRTKAMLDPEGMLPSATDSLKMRQRSAEQQQERLEYRLNEIQQRLMRQYTALDTSLANISGAFAGVEGLLNSLNNQRG